MLEISRLSLSLGQQTLLRELDLTLHPGQVHVIIGPNGTGKTSLMRTLFGELTPDSGDIRLGDQSARQMTQARWRQQFGYMPQNIQLELDLSVIEVVVLGRLDSLSMRLADEDILAAGRALQALGIAHLADRPLYSLSGGQRQMVLFAQVLHGATFGAYHAAAVVAVNEWFGSQHQARGQALYGSISFGAGGMMGGVLSGYTWDWIGSAWTYSLGAVFALIGLLVLIGGWREPSAGERV